MTDAPPLEAILEPDLPIVDPHHHLWDRASTLTAPARAEHDFDRMLRLSPRYLLDELLADLNSGHNVRATVFVQCGAMYRADGPAAFKPVGETEFVNGVAAMCASGVYGEVRACAGIVGHVDLTLGGVVSEVLKAHLKAGGGRFRGIRHSSPASAAGSTTLRRSARVMPDWLSSTYRSTHGCWSRSCRS
jgi:L-fuconolactonase